MITRLLVPILLICTSPAFADVAKCIVEIEDVFNSTDYTVEYTLTYTTDGPAHRKHFDLPGSGFSCTHAFFDFEIGTMLSCENKSDMGNTFFQTDRTSLKEKTATNSLNFRVGKTYVAIKAKCTKVW